MYNVHHCSNGKFQFIFEPTRIKHDSCSDHNFSLKRHIFFYIFKIQKKYHKLDELFAAEKN